MNTTAQQFNSTRATSRSTTTPPTRDHIFARYSKGNQYDPASNSVALLGNTVNEAYLQNGALNWTHSFSPNLTNEARFGKNYVKLPHGLTTFDSSVGALANTWASSTAILPASMACPCSAFPAARSPT